MNGAGPQGPPTDMVPIMMVPTIQGFDVAPGTINGRPAVLVRIMEPMNTKIVALGRDDALRLSDLLREHAGGLRVVDDPLTVEEILRKGDGRE